MGNPSSQSRLLHPEVRDVLIILNLKRYRRVKIEAVHLFILNHTVSKCAEAEFVQLPEEVRPWIALTVHVNVTSFLCGLCLLIILWFQPEC